MPMAAALLLVLSCSAGPARAGGGQGLAADGETRAVPADVLDDRRLRAAFLDLFGRPPFRSEREEWRGRGLRELLDEAFGREDFWSNWLDDELYYFLLIDNFRPRSERVMALPAELAAGRIDVRDAIHRILLCPSFDLRNPGADTFVTVVMEQILGLTVQKNARVLEIGKKVYDGGQGTFLGVRGSSQSDVVRIAIEDDRFAQVFLAREYRRILRAEAPRRELSRWSGRLRRDPHEYTAILKEWMTSEAYQVRLRERVLEPNRMFVAALFVDLLDRLPAPDEARRMRAALDGLSDPGPLRSVLARLVIDSGQAALPAKDAIPDPTAWVDGLFRRLLGRPASPDELKAFVTAFHEPATRPETLVYAILSHPEYHHY